jgi:hypothetical protein
MTRLALAAITASFAMISTAAPAFADAGARYQLQAVEGGVVRLDTVTGQMDFCRSTGQGLSCTVAAPAPAASAVPAAPIDPQSLQRQMRAGADTVEAVMPELIATMMRLRQSMDRELAR